MAYFHETDMYRHVKNGEWYYEGKSADGWREVQRAAEAQAQMDWAREAAQIARALEAAHAAHATGGTDPARNAPAVARRHSTANTHAGTPHVAAARDGKS